MNSLGETSFFLFYCEILVIVVFDWHWMPVALTSTFALDTRDYFNMERPRDAW